MSVVRLSIVASLFETAHAASAAYTSVGAGACRGNGGNLDKVNSRSKTGFTTELDCENACEVESTCVGFAWESSGDQTCILYGPGMSGTCASPNQATISKPDCEAIGSCDSPSAAAAEINCGTCSDGGAVRKDACEATGTWTAGTWTTSGVWETQDNGWAYEFFHTDHIHAVSPNAAWVCYDKDPGDHVGRCENAAATPGGFDCHANFTAADTYEQDSCPEAAPELCVWRKAPNEPTVKVPHPTAVEVPGWSYISGACRGTSADNAADANAPKGQDRPPHAYKKNAAFPSFPTGTSITELAALCDATPDCIAFHSGPWMSLFGAGQQDCNKDANGDTCDPPTTACLECPITGSTDANGWTGSLGQAGTTTIDASKPNHQYICYIKDTGGGLSTGALVGIIVGSVLGGILLLGLVWKFMCKKAPTSAKA